MGPHPLMGIGGFILTMTDLAAGVRPSGSLVVPISGCHVHHGVTGDGAVRIFALPSRDESPASARGEKGRADQVAPGRGRPTRENCLARRAGTSRGAAGIGEA